jgi:protoheme IX farnesyltransferase
MKSSAIELHSTAITEVRPRIGFGARISAFVELTKPRITSLIMLTAAAGFCLGSQDGTNYLLLIHAMVGIGLLASGLGTLNQFMERDLDLLMRRTMN